MLMPESKMIVSVYSILRMSILVFLLVTVTPIHSLSINNVGSEATSWWRQASLYGDSFFMQWDKVGRSIQPTPANPIILNGTMTVAANGDDNDDDGNDDDGNGGDGPKNDGGGWDRICDCSMLG